MSEDVELAEKALEGIRQADQNFLFDYTLFPCSHEVKNLTYRPVDIEGNMFCPECKRIRQIELLRVKRY